MAGPWSPWKTFADEGSKTYESQSSAILPIGETALYLGDRWCPSNLAQSTYIWLPLEKNGHDIYMKNRTSWVLDVASQSWEAGPAETHYVTNGSVPPLSSPASTVIFSATLASTKTTRTTLRVEYTNGHSEEKQATAWVNGHSQPISFLPTGSNKQGVKELGESALHCYVAAGNENEVAITVDGEGAETLKIVSVVAPSA